MLWESSNKCPCSSAFSDSKSLKGRFTAECIEIGEFISLVLACKRATAANQCTTEQNSLMEVLQGPGLLLIPA